MSMRSLVALLGLGAALMAADAQAIFGQALRSQGAIRLKEIVDVHLSFKGQIVGKDGEHHILQEVWLRRADRSFRIRTTAGAKHSARSERGVLGPQGYWDRPDDHRIKLSYGNRDHRELIKGIDADRARFERIIAMMLLAELQGAKITLAQSAPVKLEDDLPYSVSQILGDREKNEYHVLDVQRENERRLLLFVRTDDFTVRKAIQFHGKEPDRPEWWYYFGPFRRRPAALGLNVPLYFSVHTAKPTDKRSRKATGKYRGEIKVTINSGLTDRDLTG